MALQLNLQKSAAKLTLSLEKAGIDLNSLKGKIQVGYGVDVSGSYEDEHDDGVTNDLMTCFVPWGLKLDANKAIDIFSFSDGRAHALHVGTATAENYVDYIKDNVIHKVAGYGGGTHYHHVMELALEHFGWLEPSQPQSKGGFLGSLFGRSRSVQPTGSASKSVFDREPALMFINTDGGNQDKDDTRRVLEGVRERGDKVFFMFIAVSNQGDREFAWLRSIAKEFSDIVGLIEIKLDHLKTFVGQDYEAISAQVLTPSLVKWLQSQ